MKPSLDKSKVSLSFSDLPVVPTCSFYEYHWDGPKRVHVPVWQPRQTTLLVVFDGESRHFFSTARIVLYSNGSSKDARSGNVWDIQQLGSMIHSFRGQVHRPRPNPTALPTLTLAFEISVGQVTSKSSFGMLVLRSPTSIPERLGNSITVFLERELSLTSDTLSLSLSFTHSIMLYTPIPPSGSLEPYCAPTHPAARIELVTTRIVRVLPPFSPRSRRPTGTNGRLPTELLIKTFEDAEFRYSWHDDLLSFAQVCRAWSCAMDVLQSRLTFSDDDKWSHSRPLLDVYAFAKAVREKPMLGHAFRHLTTDNFGKPEDWQDEDELEDVFRLAAPQRKKKNATPVRFTAALITVLGTTRNLQCVHLGQLDPSQSDALFNVLYDLHALRTCSIGPIEYPKPLGRLIKHPRGGGGGGGGGDTPRMLSILQLARCMAKWPLLTTLKIHHLHPGIINLCRFALRPPACTLTQLCLSRAHVGDRDLIHLFASSGKTLERVALDSIEGVTNAGLVAFLLAVSQNVVYLTVRDVALPPYRQRGHLVIGRTERALDAVVDKMPRLCELRIGGDVASEFMLDRRSKMFVGLNTPLEGARMSVVRLWLEDVPRLCGFAADGKWPGWCTPGKGPRR